MKISVIIPSYKPQGYIWECLDSLKNQTLPKEDFEVILVLNGCNQPYKTEITEYIEKNLSGYNVNFIQTDTPGVSNARNMALDCAKGDYIAFVDDDDYLSDVYLESMLFKAKHDTIVLSNTIALKNDNRDTPLRYQLSEVYRDYQRCQNINLASKVRKYFSGPCMKLIPIEVIGDRRYDVRFKNGEDSIFMFLISDRFENIVFASEDAIYYRVYRDDSATTKKRGRRERIKNNINSIIEYSKIYSIRRYHFIFYMSRLMAEIRCFVNNIFN